MKIKSIHRVVVWGTLLLAMTALFGLDLSRKPDYLGFDHWSQANGLQQTTVRVILQSSDGFLWLGTSGGLIRFDGMSFDRFSVQNNSLEDNEVRSLAQDHSGGLWIGTFGGGLTHFHQGRFRTFTTRDGLPDNVVRKVCRDKLDRIWVATQRGVSRYSGGVFQVFGDVTGLTGRLVIDLCATPDGTVYAMTRSALFRFAGERWEPVTNGISLSDGAFRLLCSGAGDSVWIVFENGLIKHLNSSGFSVHPVDSKKIYEINAIYEDPQGTLWLGAALGLWRLKNGAFESVQPRTAGNELRRIRSLVMDHEGSLWIGLGADGLGRIRNNQLYTLSTEDGLPDENIRVIFEDHHGNIWIGTGNGLARYADGQSIEVVPAGGRRLPVNSLAEDADGTLLVGSNQSLYVLKENHLVPYPGWVPAPSAIRTMVLDGHHRLWVGTESNGLYWHENGGDKPFQPVEGLASNAIRSLFADRSGGVWIATLGGGVCRFAEGAFHRFPEIDRLSVNYVYDLHEDPDGTLWALTRTGLLRWKAGRCTLITEKDGLTSNYAFRIVDDGEGHFWFTSVMGIFQVDRKQLNDLADGVIKKITPVSFGVKNGMSTDVCSVAGHPSGFRTSRGILLFPTLKGLVVVDRHYLDINPLPPPVAIWAVKVNGSEVDPQQHAILDPDSNEIEVQYAGLSYLVPEKVLFRYWLEGSDKTRVEEGTRRFAHYAKLPPGKYTFHVTACNNNGIWNPKEATFSFYLQPHYYQTYWFYGLCTLLCALMIGLVVEFRLKHAKARQKELEERVEQAVAHLKTLKGLLPICASCKKIRDDKGYWNQLEEYVRDHSQADFSHSICPECMARLYPEYFEDLTEEKNRG